MSRWLDNLYKKIEWRVAFLQNEQYTYWDDYLFLADGEGFY